MFTSHLKIFLAREQSVAKYVAHSTAAINNKQIKTTLTFSSPLITVKCLAVCSNSPSRPRKLSSFFLSFFQSRNHKHFAFSTHLFLNSTEVINQNNMSPINTGEILLAPSVLGRIFHIYSTFNLSILHSF